MSAPRRRAHAPPPSKATAILRAATELFSRYGFRKTSIDMIAAEAGVAKPTVYAHFADKDALFVAVCDRLTTEMVTAATAAAEHEREIVDRLSAMLSAKFTTMFALVESSPHARELLDSSNTLANEVVDAADQRYERVLVAAVRAAVSAGELDLRRVARSPRAFAAMLMQAGHGAGHHAKSPEQHRSNLRELVRMLVEATRARHPRSGSI